MLHGLYALMKEITKLFWFSFLVVAVIKMFFIRDMSSVLAIRAGLLAALLFVLTELAYYLIISWLRRREDKHIADILLDDGVTPQLLWYITRRVKKAKTPVRKASEQLTLASFLSEGGYFDRCFETLREIDFSSLNEGCREEYFNIYVYSNLMAGDVAAAERIFEVSKPYFDRAQEKSYSMPVLHTMGVLEYAKQNYVTAENYFIQALSASRGSFSLCECQIYLSLCYINMGKLGHAAYYARCARSNISTFYQRRTLENVRMQIEQAAA